MIGLTSATLRGTRPASTPDGTMRALLGPEVAVAMTDPRAEQGALYPEEVSTMARATPARQAEFAAGRAAARAAMRDLGRPGAPVPCARDRSPVWPRGLTGSISHTDKVCLAAVAESEKLRSIGIDIEPDAPLEPDLTRGICTLAERAWLAIQPEETRGFLAKLIFSAKECAYKCQYPVTGMLFDFDTLEITPDLDTGQFEATFLRDIGPFPNGTCFHGRFAVQDGLIMTATVLARSPRWAAGGQ